VTSVINDNPRFERLPKMSNHNLINSYVCAHAFMGHGCEPWLIAQLAYWLYRGAKPELERRGLLKEAERAEQSMRKDHHARTVLDARIA
jgi:hypothetical protein